MSREEAYVALSETKLAVKRGWGYIDRVVEVPRGGWRVLGCSSRVALLSPTGVVYKLTGGISGNEQQNRREMQVQTRMLLDGRDYAVETKRHVFVGFETTEDDTWGVEGGRTWNYQSVIEAEYIEEGGYSGEVYDDICRSVICDAETEYDLEDLSDSEGYNVIVDVRGVGRIVDAGV